MWLDLAVVLHNQGSHAWLRVMGAGLDLRLLAALTARRAAEHRDDPTMMGLAVWGDGLLMLAAGDFDLARDELDSVTVPTSNPESMQLAGMLALCRSLVAAADKRPADVDAALDHAGELAARTGDGNAAYPHLTGHCDHRGLKWCPLRVPAFTFVTVCGDTGEKHLAAQRFCSDVVSDLVMRGVSTAPFIGKGPDPFFEPLGSQFATIQSSLRVSVRNVIVSVGELASTHKRSMIIK
jgi:hypothetical protein